LVRRSPLARAPDGLASGDLKPQIDSDKRAGVLSSSVVDSSKITRAACPLASNLGKVCMGKVCTGRFAMDAITAFCDHAMRTRFADLPSEVVRAAKIFMLDTLGVGIAGSSEPMAGNLAQVQDTWGRGGAARVWDNTEFDCVHEEAVVHALSVVLPVALAGAERRKGVSGRDLMSAVAVGVDLAAGLGIAATTGLRFFRPATAGAFGGTAALGMLMGLDRSAMINAFSIVYGQVCGTMQAHSEGSPLLAMQVGFNARNAVVACDLAAQGFAGPKDVLEGPFGYFTLIELAGEPARVTKDLGQRWLITELAHKPYPSGRATHGIIEGCLELQRRHGFAAQAIDRVTARVPPLVHRLVGRPYQVQPSANYARLCASYVAACALLKGAVGFADFRLESYRDASIAAMAQRIAIEPWDIGNCSALTPVEIEIALRDGARHVMRLDVVYGNPAKPLSRDDHLAKFRRNCAAAAHPLTPEMAERLIERFDRLEDVADVAALIDLAAC
jgi:aconitate decarboxylase